MSTVATATMKKFAADWQKVFKSAEISGIVGDAAHQARGGYHIGRKFQSATNYSVVRPDDKGGPDDAAAAVDMTMNKADMMLCTKRLKALHDNVNDPRRKYLNAFNGWDGTGDATRYDIYARTSKTATPIHKSHVHCEWRRKYVDSSTAAKAILSGVKGETVATYMKSIGVAPAPPKPTTAATAKVAPPWPGKTFKRNPTMKADPDLAKWQKRMIERGWTSLGTADGKFGDKTESVVLRFQATCKVVADGEIGKVTWPLPWTRPMGS